MCELCAPSRHPPTPPGPELPSPGAGGDGRPGVWPHLSGVRGHLAIHPLRTGTGSRPAGDAVALVLRGALTHQVLAWSDELGPDVLARVRVVRTVGLTHLDDAGRALLVDLVRVAVRQGRRLHLPEPSDAATTVLARLGLLAAVDTGPDPWPPGEADGAGSRS